MSYIRGYNKVENQNYHPDDVRHPSNRESKKSNKTESETRKIGQSVLSDKFRDSASSQSSRKRSYRGWQDKHEHQRESMQLQWEESPSFQKAGRGRQNKQNILLQSDMSKEPTKKAKKEPSYKRDERSGSDQNHFFRDRESDVYHPRNIQEHERKQHATEHNSLVREKQGKSPQESQGKSDPRLVPFNRALTQAVKARDEEQVKELLAKIQSLGLELDSYSYSSLIRLYLNLGSIEKVFEKLQEMKEKKIQPHAGCYNSLLNFYVDKEEVDEVERIFNDMTAAEVQPNDVTYRTLLKLFITYVKRRNVGGAEKVFDMMEATGVKSKVSLYGRLFNLHEKFDDLVGAKKLLSKMKTASVQPDNVNLTNLFRFSLVKADLEWAREILSMMNAAGCLPGDILASYNKLLNQYVEREDLRGASNVLSDMKELGLKPDLWTYSTLLKLSLKKDGWEGGKKLLEKMREAEVQPNEVIYNTLFTHCMLKTEDLEGAKTVLNMMKDAGISPNERIYNALLNFYINKKESRMAKEVYDEMEKEGIQDESTLTAYFALVLNERDISELDRLLHKMDQLGIKPSPHVTVRLIEAYFETDIDRASDLFKNIAHKHIQQRAEGVILDCHELSHAGACTMLNYYLKSEKSKTQKFIVVTGTGMRHPTHEPFAMRDRVQSFLRDFFPQIKVEEDKKRRGRLICYFPRKD